MSFTTRRIREEKPRRRRDLLKTGARFLAFARPLFLYYTDWKRRQEGRKRTALLKRTVVILATVFLVFLLFSGIAKALLMLRSITVPTILNVAGAELPADENGFTNVLLLGAGDVTHDGKDLTDTVMVVSLDPKKTKSAVLLSLPRDLYFLNTEKMGKGRINSLYRDYKGFLRFQKGMPEQEASLEALRELAKEIGNSLELTIHHVVKVDFIGFVKAVDAIGGMELDVPEDIVDTAYPGPDYTFETFTIHKGLQHLDGETALKFVRSRHTSSDFDRSERQQLLLSALADKVRSQGILGNSSKIAALYRIVSENSETTMNLRELVGLAKLGSSVDRSRIIAMQLSDRNGLYETLAEPGGLLYAPPRDLFEGASVLLPVSIPEFPVTWKQVQTFSRMLFTMRSIHLSRPRMAILNAGAKSGLGRTLGTELVRFGFAVEEIENAGIGKLDHSLVAVQSRTDEHAGTFFSSLLGVPVAPLPEGIAPDLVRDVTIVLGKDYVYTPLQDLLLRKD